MRKYKQFHIYIKNDRVLLTNKYLGDKYPLVNTLFATEPSKTAFNIVSYKSFNKSSNSIISGDKGVFLYLDNAKNVCLLTILDDLGELNPTLHISNNWYIYASHGKYIFSRKVICGRVYKYHFSKNHVK